MVSGCRGVAVALSILHEGTEDLQLEATQMSAFLCITEKKRIWRQCGLSD